MLFALGLIRMLVTAVVADVHRNEHSAGPQGERSFWSSALAVTLAEVRADDVRALVLQDLEHRYADRASLGRSQPSKPIEDRLVAVFVLVELQRVGRGRHVRSKLCERRFGSHSAGLACMRAPSVPQSKPPSGRQVGDKSGAE